MNAKTSRTITATAINAFFIEKFDDDCSVFDSELSDVFVHWIERFDFELVIEEHQILLEKSDHLTSKLLVRQFWLKCP